MLTNAMLLVALLAAAALLIWSVRRAWRSPRAVVRWPVSLLAGLFGLIFLVISGAALRGMWMAYSHRGAPVTALVVERTPQRLARGEHVARVTCAGCHSTSGDVPLSGGKNLSDDTGMPLGVITPFNLTPAGPIRDWTDAEIFRAVRDAADRDQRPLVVMSTQGVRNLSDEDVRSVVAFLRNQPPVERLTPPERLSFLSMVLAGAGMIPLDLSYRPERITAPRKAGTSAYGEYIVNWGGCRQCHGADLLGGKSIVVPNGPNLRVVKGWTREQFIQTLRAGVDPYGKHLKPDLMPWKFIGRLDDDELSALYAYLSSLPTPAAGGTAR